ncbi:hypothetical protein [Rhodococcoides fascians]|uniref:hypothetical protein n=1 Tax=Rhodococcoides fascians TaxID=1828 RepID=UPI0027810EAF|nr:hypothetical protein [Rhodococcus fascians]MDQ0284860.1 hypothetical protein [Rhodococcus fascians]
MEKSATQIGRAIGKTAREVNALLHEYDYLTGPPGDYSMTEKGQEYGSERDHHRGTGGYAHYNRTWVTRTWDERIVAALADDMAAGGPIITETAEPIDDLDREGKTEQKDETGRPVWAVAAVVGGVAVAVVGGFVVATSPRVHRWAGENVTPRARKVWRKLARRGDVEPVADNDDVVPSDAIALPEGEPRGEIFG